MPHWLPQHAILTLSAQHDFPLAEHWPLPAQQEPFVAFAESGFMHLVASPQHAFPSLPQHAMAVLSPFACFEWQQDL
jgi:hypothetical protein